MIRLSSATYGTTITRASSLNPVDSEDISSCGQLEKVEMSKAVFAERLTKNVYRENRSRAADVLPNSNVIPTCRLKQILNLLLADFKHISTCQNHSSHVFSRKYHLKISNVSALQILCQQMNFIDKISNHGHSKTGR